jgi:hypothetical protein
MPRNTNIPLGNSLVKAGSVTSFAIPKRKMRTEKKIGIGLTVLAAGLLAYYALKDSDSVPTSSPVPNKRNIAHLVSAAKFLFSTAK